jgi:hypothetical protein
MEKKQKKAEELATDEHGKTRKQQKQRRGKKAEKGRRISHGRTRKNTEAAEELLIQSRKRERRTSGKKKKDMDASQNNINLS